jgi:hypothetical protein
MVRKMDNLCFGMDNFEKIILCPALGNGFYYFKTVKKKEYLQLPVTIENGHRRGILPFFSLHILLNTSIDSGGPPGWLLQFPALPDNIFFSLLYSRSAIKTDRG